MRLRLISANIGMLLMLGLIVTFLSCAKPGENSSASSKNEPAKPAASPTEKASTPVAASTPSAAAIATSDGENSGTRVEVTELKRSSDNTVTLKFAMVNDSDKPIGFGYDFGDKANDIKDHASIGGVTLVDSAGKKKYFVVRDSDNSCLCSRAVKDIAPKSRANLWAKFPAPPDDVQKISIVIPHFAPMDDVAISH